MLYTVQFGDSPALIARRFGVSMEAIIGANPQKPTTVVAGQRTWQSVNPSAVTTDRTLSSGRPLSTSAPSSISPLAPPTQSK